MPFHKGDYHDALRHKNNQVDGAHPRRLIHPAPPVFECKSVCV